MDAQQILAMLWYSSPTQYRSARKLMADALLLPGRFSHWRVSAERVVTLAESKGVKVERVALDSPAAFKEFCRRMDIDADAQARQSYAMALAAARQK
jgi:hypothetical protein